MSPLGRMNCGGASKGRSSWYQWLTLTLGQEDGSALRLDTGAGHELLPRRGAAVRSAGGVDEELAESGAAARQGGEVVVRASKRHCTVCEAFPGPERKLDGYRVTEMMVASYSLEERTGRPTHQASSRMSPREGRGLSSAVLLKARGRQLTPLPTKRGHVVLQSLS